ncbi:MAG TPA: class I SAM-dependent methyltransferase [Xanthobacteraceae bacterium]|nr:class I SAM-dependent methyltransferase [Xanthobacteraceae bacterium]
MTNIAYQSDAIARHYSTHRRRWNYLYPSERTIFDRLRAENARLGRVLDVGCAAGGLAAALAERFASIESYTGIDINPQAIEAARRLAKSPFETRFLNADICQAPSLPNDAFDLVAALSVADWNVDANGILSACWRRVAPGGHLVISLRLTPGAGICDMSRSFQFIWFEDSPPPADAERAAYNIFNVREAVRMLGDQVPKPERITLYGYWGKPSATAHTPYERLIFSVIAMRRPEDASFSGEPMLDASLPLGAIVDV